MKSRAPRVSIIMIFLDAERFIEEAIASVFAQDFDSWELLLVDDGSRDASRDLARGLARRRPGEVRYLTHAFHRNRGMSASRNRGLAAARGEFVTFLDSDDVWRPGKLSAQVRLLDAHPEAAALTAPAEWWYSWSGAAEDAGRDFVQRWSLPMDALVRPPDILDMFLADEWASLCDVVVRREVMVAVGGYEKAFRGLYEDQVFHAKIALEHPVWIAGESWYRYRQHDCSSVARAWDEGTALVSRRRFLDWVGTHLARRRLSFASTGAHLVEQRALLPHEEAAPREGLFRRIRRRA